VNPQSAITRPWQKEPQALSNSLEKPSANGNSEQYKMALFLLFLVQQTHPLLRILSEKDETLERTLRLTSEVRWKIHFCCTTKEPLRLQTARQRMAVCPQNKSLRIQTFASSKELQKTESAIAVPFNHADKSAEFLRNPKSRLFTLAWHLTLEKS
jgi:hypothetical protein